MATFATIPNIARINPRIRFVWAAIIFVSCGGPAAVSPSSAATPTPSISTTSGGSAACVVRAGGPGTPVQDPTGPFSHNMAIARTSDGLQLTAHQQVLEHASVPDGVRLRDGSTLVYYVNGALGYVWVARVIDAGSGPLGVTPLGPLRINGVDTPVGIVDPDATLMPDGRVRLTYLSGFGPPGSGVPRAMCNADSDDGLSFTVVGAALSLSDENSTDPSVVRLSDGNWLMAHSRGQTSVISRSIDGGRTFTTEQTVSFGGVPELSIAPDGRVRLYVCTSGVSAYASSDLGRTWTLERSILAGTPSQRIVCDPSMVRESNLFIYKTAP